MLEKILHWVPWTARKSNQSVLKEINPEYPLEGLMLKPKLQYFGHLMWRAGTLEKTLMLERLKAAGQGDEMVGWHHQLNGHNFEQTQEIMKGKEAWCAAVHGATKSWTWLINNLQKSSVIRNAWSISRLKTITTTVKLICSQIFCFHTGSLGSDVIQLRPVISGKTQR